MKKTWTQKRDGAPAPHVSVLEKAMFGLAPGTRLYISSPREVETYIAAISSGEVRDIVRMRQDLAAKAGAEATCPMTASIFARIVAEAALDDMRDGKPEGDVAPFWRLIDPKSPLAGKLSCGPDYIRHRRAFEDNAV